MCLRFPAYAALLLLLPAFLSAAPPPTIVSFTYQGRQAEVLVTLNGFPILEASNEHDLTGGLPVNVHLHPTGNVLAVDFRPLAGTDGEANASLQVGISAAQPGETVDTDEAGTLINLNLTGVEGPATVTETFDLPEEMGRPAYHCAERYRTAPVVEDEAAVQAYAMELVGLMTAQDFETLVEHFAPKMADYDCAFDYADRGVDPNDELLRFLRETFNETTLNTATRPEQLDLVPWVEGRIWEVQQADSAPLFVAVESDGSSVALPVYVGIEDGTLHIVR